MGKFIKIKSGITTYKVHYSQLYQNMETKQWYWNGYVITILSDKKTVYDLLDMKSENDE